MFYLFFFFKLPAPTKLVPGTATGRVHRIFICSGKKKKLLSTIYTDMRDENIITKQTVRVSFVYQRLLCQYRFTRIPLKPKYVKYIATYIFYIFVI